MKKLLATLVFLGLAVYGHAQMFHPEYSTRDIRAEYGLCFPVGMPTVEKSQSVTVLYTAQFWRSLAYKGGVQAGWKVWDYDSFIGVPIALAYRPGIASWKDALGNAVEMSVWDTVRNGATGRPDRIGSAILSDLVFALFRRLEYCVGITPGYYAGAFTGDPAEQTEGNRFSLTADVSMVFSMPIWHFSINVTPAYHYCFTQNAIYHNAPQRHYFSISAGLGWLF